MEMKLSADRLNFTEEGPTGLGNNNENHLQKETCPKELQSSENVEESSSGCHDSKSVATEVKPTAEIETMEDNSNNNPGNSENTQLEETSLKATPQVPSSEKDTLNDSNGNCLEGPECDMNYTATTNEDQLASPCIDNEGLSGIEPKQLPKLQLEDMQEHNTSEEIIQHSTQKNPNESKKKNLTRSKKQTEATGLKDNKGASISRKNSATLLSGQASSPSPLKRRSSSRSLKVSEEKPLRNTSPDESDANSPAQLRTVPSKADSASSEHQMSQPSLVRRSSSKTLYKPTQSSAAKEKKKQESTVDNGRDFHTPGKIGLWSSKKGTTQNGNSTGTYSL